MKPDNHPVDSEIIQETAQVGEAVADPFLPELLGKVFDITGESMDLIKNIPIAQILSLIYNGSEKYKNYTMKKKLTKFIFPLSLTSEAERKRFEQKLENDKQYKERFLDNLILILEKIDEMEKAAILGKLFVALIRENILSEEYHRLNVMINRAYSADLKELSQNHSDLSVIDLSIRKQLASDGFLQERTINDGGVLHGGRVFSKQEGSEEEQEERKKQAIQEVKERDRVHFSITHYGQLFIDLNLYSD